MLKTLLADSGDSNGGWTLWVMIGAVVLIIAALLILPMITNKRRAKIENSKRDSLCVGDTIMTIGGIVGVVQAINDINPNRREFVLETGEGDNKTTITFDIKALYIVIDSVNKPVTPFEGGSKENLKLDESAAAFADPSDELAKYIDNASAPAEGNETAGDGENETAEQKDE